MSAGNCGSNSCPEAPDITVNQTILNIDDEPALFVQDAFVRGDSTGGLGLVFTFSKLPYESYNVIVSRNGVIGALTTDYTINSQTLTLVNALGSDEKLLAFYMSLEQE